MVKNFVDMANIPKPEEISFANPKKYLGLKMD
jgi:hypothetical protein